MPRDRPMQQSHLTTVDVPTTKPREAISAAVEETNAAATADLLVRIREQEPDFLGRLVLRLLTAMGTEGAAESAERLGRSGDEGLDGVIGQDTLGLDRIYVQARRCAEDRPISRPDIQGFVGALHRARADRGVFITTSRFTPDAEKYAQKIQARVILIDGVKLAALMIEKNVGVQDRKHVCSSGSTRTASRRRDGHGGSLYTCQPSQFAVVDPSPCPGWNLATSPRPGHRSGHRSWATNGYRGPRRAARTSPLSTRAAEGTEGHRQLRRWSEGAQIPPPPADPAASVQVTALPGAAGAALHGDESRLPAMLRQCRRHRRHRKARRNPVTSPPRCARPSSLGTVGRM